MTDHVLDLLAAITRLREVVERIGHDYSLVYISIDDGAKGMRLRSLLLSNYMFAPQGHAMDAGRGCELVGVQIKIASCVDADHPDR